MTTLLFLLATGVPAQPPAPAADVDVKQLEAWVADLASADYKKQTAAAAALAKAGPKALPVLPELIKLVERKQDHFNWSTAYAIDVVGAIGPEAKDVVPALMTHIKTGFGQNYLDNIALSLAKIDKPRPEATRALLLSSSKGSTILLKSSTYLKSFPAAAAAHLITLCGDKDLETRRRAAVILGGLPTMQFEAASKPLLLEVMELAKDGFAKLETMLADEEPVVRLTAAHAISHAAADRTASVIPTVVAVMSDPKVEEKVRGYSTVSILSPAPKEAATALMVLFDGTNPGRSWAMAALADLPVIPQLEAELKEGKTARRREASAISLGSRRAATGSSTIALKAALRDSESVVRFAAASALVRQGGRMSEPVALIVPALTEGLKQEDEANRLQAAERLAVMGPKAKTAVGELKRVLEDPKPDVAFAAALALVEIAQAEVGEVIPVLISGLQSDKEPVFIRAARALSVFGQAAKAGVPELTRHFKSLKPLTQVAAAEAVAQIDPAQTEKAVEVLVAVVLKYRNTNTQHVAALNALATIGPPAKSALPALLATLPGEGKKDRYVPPELALAVLAIDKDTAKPVLAFIQETIRQADVNDEIDLARQVRKLGSRAKPLMAEIITMLDAKDSYVRECAALTLGEIGPDAKDALPKLKELATKGGNAEAILRKYAVEAVKKIEVK